MSVTAADQSEAKPMPEPQSRFEKHGSSQVPVDRFAEARRAKRKAKRVKHRAKLKRSNTSG
jgi:hypothetical protein